MPENRRLMTSFLKDGYMNDKKPLYLIHKETSIKSILKDSFVTPKSLNTEISGILPERELNLRCKYIIKDYAIYWIEYEDELYDIIMMQSNVKHQVGFNYLLRGTKKENIKDNLVEVKVWKD